MSEFERTFVRLQADSGKATLWTLSAAGAALLVWLSWAVFGRVWLYEVSPDARVELDGATFSIDSPFLGRVVATNLQVGRHVRQGDLLVELDAMAERLQRQQEQVRTQGLEPQLERLRSQIEAENATRAEENRAARLRREEALSRMREAQLAAQFAEREASRIHKLHEQHLVSAQEFEKADNEAGRLKLAVATQRAAVERIPQEQAARDRERDVRIARLEGEVAMLNTQREASQADAARLDYEQERRRIRAPADGRIGEAANLRVGAVVPEGSRLGSIIPPGRLLIVAQYPARAAFGRIRAGQSATLRLDGFPWAEFGAVAAKVTRVAEEIRDGKVRVELALGNKSSFQGVLEHGMPGTLEVAVERVSPLELTMRAAGQWLSKPL
jgi:membrane fusion protein (multidrug efflux system)